MSVARNVKSAALSSVIATTADAGKTNGPVGPGQMGGMDMMDDGLMRGAPPCSHLELCTLENSYVCPTCDSVTIRTTMTAAKHELAALVEADHASTTALHRALAYLCP